MARVINKFLVASMIMWMAPIAILYCCNNRIIPGLDQLSSSSQTILSGFLAVISVNLVIVLYIVMAMKEPSVHEPHPDPAFKAEAKASITRLTSSTTNGDTETRQKVE